MLQTQDAKLRLGPDQVAAICLTPATMVDCSRVTGQSAFDYARALERLDGDGEFLAEVIQLFRSDSTPRLSELRAAVTAGDSQRLHRSAHALKGAIGYLCAESTSAAVLDLEKIGLSGQLSDAEAALQRLEAELKLLSVALAEFVGNHAGDREIEP